MSYLYKSVLCILIIAGFSIGAFGQTIMIVHPDNPVKKAARADVANFYLGKVTQWSGGVKVKPIDHTKNSDAGKAFLSKIVKMSETEFKNYWVEKMLTGEAEPPKAVDSDDDVIKFVKENNGAIGYISAAKKTDGVVVLQLDDAEQG